MGYIIKVLKFIRYYTKPNYYSLVKYNYTNYINPSNYRKRRYDNNSGYRGNRGNGGSFNKKSKSNKDKDNKDKDNKDNKPKDKVYIIKNNNSGSINTNIIVAKLDIITYFINLLFSTRP